MEESLRRGTFRYALTGLSVAQILGEDPWQKSAFKSSIFGGRFWENLPPNDI